MGPPGAGWRTGCQIPDLSRQAAPGFPASHCLAEKLSFHTMMDVAVSGNGAANTTVEYPVVNAHSQIKASGPATARLDQNQTLIAR